MDLLHQPAVLFPQHREHLPLQLSLKLIQRLLIVYPTFSWWHLWLELQTARLCIWCWTIFFLTHPPGHWSP